MKLNTDMGMKECANMIKSKYFDFRKFYIIDYDQPQDGNSTATYLTDDDSVAKLVNGQFDLMTSVNYYIPISNKDTEEIEPEDFMQFGKIFLNPEKVLTIQRLTELRQTGDVGKLLGGGN